MSGRHSRTSRRHWAGDVKEGAIRTCLSCPTRPVVARPRCCPSVRRPCRAEHGVGQQRQWYSSGCSSPASVSCLCRPIVSSSIVVSMPPHGRAVANREDLTTVGSGTRLRFLRRSQQFPTSSSADRTSSRGSDRSVARQAVVHFHEPGVPTTRLVKCGKMSPSDARCGCFAKEGCDANHQYHVERKHQ